MNKIDLRRLAAGAIACGCALPEFAAGQDTTQLQEVVVTASRSPELLQQVPASVSVITADQIRDTPAQGLDDILQLVPGMNLTQMGPDVGHPTAYNEGMRGLPTTETRFLVLVDGIPVNDPFFGYIQWNRIPLDNIERVEIVRGGGAPLWGNGTMGGVINIITRTPTDSMLDVDVAGGSYGSYRTSVYGAYRASNSLVLSMNTSFSGTGGYQTTPASWTSYGTTTLRSPVYTPTSFDARNVSLRADYTPSTDLSGFFVVNYYDGNQVLTTPIGVDAQRTWSYSGQLSKTFQNGGVLTATVFHDDSNFVTNNPHLLSFTTEYNSNIHSTPVNDTGGSLTWTQDVGSIFKSYTFGMDAHEITGGDYSDYYLPSGAIAAPTIIGSGKQLFVGGFAEVRLEPIDHLEIAGSVRYQYYRNYDGVDTFPPAIGAIPTSSQDSVDPRLDIRYALSDEFALRGAYYKSFRAPTLDQLYRTYADTTAGIYEGNPFLKPETLKGGEVGLDFNHDGFRSQFTLYDTTITNLITQRNLTPAENPTALGVVCGYDAATYTYLTCTRLINAASAVARGAEWEADWNLGHGVSTGFGYTYADSHYTANAEDPTAVGERLEGVPKQNVSGRLAYQASAGWRIATDLRWVSKSYGDAHPEDNLIQNAHFVMDVSGSYPLTKRLQAYVQIENLTDTRYIANNDGAAPILGTPREFMVGLHLSMK
jgi:outer membrane receptor protein involved in Fe transport